MGQQNSPIKDYRLKAHLTVDDLPFSKSYIKRIEDGLYYDLPIKYLEALVHLAKQPIGSLIADQQQWRFCRRLNAPEILGELPIPEVLDFSVNPFVRWLDANQSSTLAACRTLCVPQADLQSLVTGRAASVPNKFREVMIEVGLLDLIVKLSGQYVIYRSYLIKPTLVSEY